MAEAAGSAAGAAAAATAAAGNPGGSDERTGLPSSDGSPVVFSRAGVAFLPGARYIAPMPARLSAAILIAYPCLIALLVYDWVAVVLLAKGPYPVVIWHSLARDFLEDLGVTAVYAVVVTPRVSAIVAGYPPEASRLCLIMLGLGLAWYVVICAWLTRQLAEPPGLVLSIVVLFVIPAILAPWYVRWIRTKVPDRGNNGPSGTP